jgi:putative FmdB family regulatory protein
MPLFDYKCRSCDYIHEYIVKDYMEEKKCPRCDVRMERQVGVTNFRLYGEGFYKPNKK